MTDLHAKDVHRYAVHRLCELFGVSKQAYYKYDNDMALAKAARISFVVEYVKAVRSRDRGIGGQLLYVKYRNEFGPAGDTEGRDVLTFPNLIWDFIPTAPNQLWVSDIT